jgi:serine-type D-Ala-D-Ala carboxypeptidase/endopeptidase
MKKILITCLLLALSQIITAQTNDEYKKLFQDKIEFDKSGSSIVAVFMDEKGTRFVNYGNLGKDASSAATNENSIYEIGSITKMFVGVLLADAVKRGEVKLDAPISAYLPKTVKTPKFNGKEITLLDLATHSASLPRVPNNFMPKDEANPYIDYTTQNLYSFLSDYKITREIGVQYDYSNLGVGLLGHILSLRAKMPLEQLLTARIFKPLGMNDTSFALPTAKKSRHAQGFDKNNQPTSLWFFDSLAGAGAIRSTATDMAKFISAAAGITKSSLADAFLEAQKVQRQGQNDRVKIGLCWNNVEVYGTEFYWFGGGTGGFRSYIAIDAKQKKGAYLVNNSGQDEMSEFLESVAFNYLQPKIPIQKPSPPKKEITLNEDILQKYVGEYQVTADVSIFITREGKRIFARASGQDRFEIFPEKEDEFFAKVAGITISFKKDRDGKPDKLIITQDDGGTPAKKVK